MYRAPQVYLPTDEKKFRYISVRTNLQSRGEIDDLLNPSMKCRHCYPKTVFTSYGL